MNRRKRSVLPLYIYADPYTSRVVGAKRDGIRYEVPKSVSLRLKVGDVLETDDLPLKLQWHWVDAQARVRRNVEALRRVAKGCL